jgi:hypothetical protein
MFSQCTVATARHRMLLFACMVVFILPLIVIFVVAKAVDEEARWAMRVAVVLNMAIFCVAVAAFAVIEFALL